MHVDSAVSLVHTQSAPASSGESHLADAQAAFASVLAESVHTPEAPQPRVGQPTPQQPQSGADRAAATKTTFTFVGTVQRVDLPAHVQETQNIPAHVGQQRSASGEIEQNTPGLAGQVPAPLSSENGEQVFTDVQNVRRDQEVEEAQAEGVPAPILADGVEQDTEQTEDVPAPEGALPYQEASGKQDSAQATAMLKVDHMPMFTENGEVKDPLTPSQTPKSKPTSEQEHDQEGVAEPTPSLEAKDEVVEREVLARQSTVEAEPANAQPAHTRVQDLSSQNEGVHLKLGSQRDVLPIAPVAEETIKVGEAELQSSRTQLQYRASALGMSADEAQPPHSGIQIDEEGRVGKPEPSSKASANSAGVSVGTTEDSQQPLQYSTDEPTLVSAGPSEDGSTHDMPPQSDRGGAITASDTQSSNTPEGMRVASEATRAGHSHVAHTFAQRGEHVAQHLAEPAPKRASGQADISALEVTLDPIVKASPQDVLQSGPSPILAQDSKAPVIQTPAEAVIPASKVPVVEKGLPNNVPGQQTNHERMHEVVHASRPSRSATSAEPPLSVYSSQAQIASDVPESQTTSNTGLVIEQTGSDSKHQIEIPILSRSTEEGHGPEQLKPGIGQGGNKQVRTNVYGSVSTEEEGVAQQASPALREIGVVSHVEAHGMERPARGDKIEMPIANNEQATPGRSIESTTSHMPEEAAALERSRPIGVSAEGRSVNEEPSVTRFAEAPESTSVRKVLDGKPVMPAHTRTEERALDASSRAPRHVEAAALSLQQASTERASSYSEIAEEVDGNTKQVPGPIKDPALPATVRQREVGSEPLVAMRQTENSEEIRPTRSNAEPVPVQQREVSSTVHSAPTDAMAENKVTADAREKSIADSPIPTSEEEGAAGAFSRSQDQDDRPIKAGTPLVMKSVQGGSLAESRAQQPAFFETLSVDKTLENAEIEPKKPVGAIHSMDESELARQTFLPDSDGKNFKSAERNSTAVDEQTTESKVVDAGSSDTSQEQSTSGNQQESSAFDQSSRTLSNTPPSPSETAFDPHATQLENPRVDPIIAHSEAMPEGEELSPELVDGKVEAGSLVSAEASTRTKSAIGTSANRSVLSAAWMRTLSMSQAPQFTSGDGWHVLEMKLDEGDGTVTIKAQKQDESVAVSVGFSDPTLRALASSQMDRIQEALQDAYNTSVDLSLADGSGQSAQQGARNGQGQPGSTGLEERAAIPTSEADQSLRTRMAGALNEWVG